MSTSDSNIESLEQNQSCCSSQDCCAPATPFTREIKKVGRNDPCPCGNGRKFKKCCGKNA